MSGTSPQVIIIGRIKQSIWLLPLALAGLVAGLGWWGNGRLRDTIQDQVRAQLKATLNANVTALGIWATNQTRLATSLAEDATVRSLADQLLATAPPGRRGFRPSPEQEQFVRELKPRLPQLGYQVAQLVNTNFQVVATSLHPQWGNTLMVSEEHTNEYAELFASGQPVIITPFKPDMLVQRRFPENAASRERINDYHRFNRPDRRRRGDITLMQVAAPVRDPGGRVVGALAMIINPDKEFSRILSVARSGDSGETYAFDQTGLLISHSRFDDQLKRLGLLEATNTSSALNLRLHDPGGNLTKGLHLDETNLASRPLIRLVADALDGEGKVLVQPTRDYRGVPVVGASRWLPDFGFGVATQMDADEAYRPLHVLQTIFVVLFLFLLLCATGLFIMANLTWRRRLSAAELKLKQLGQYTLEEKIGEGGMGVVYRARHALLRRDTAVKLLLPDHANPATLARFEQEVRLTCQLTHPNTIQVYDYGHTPDGIFYYAMEFLQGLNLHDLVARFGPQSEGRVIYILTQICDSLAEAHALGLIHRDIKPGNVFLCRRGGVPDCVKVLDFGLVQEYHAGGPEGPANHHQRDDVIEGTPWFMPPEAIHGSSPVDPRSDLYAVGVLGYYLLTGQYVFDAETTEEIHNQQLNAVPVPPSYRTKNAISPGMEKLLLRCLEKDPALRPQSAGELRSLLQQLPVATAWSPALRSIWWESCQRELAASLEEDGAAAHAPMATVRVDLSSRMER